MILHTFDTITIDTYEAAINDVNALKRVSIYIPKKILNKRMDTITKKLNLLLSDNILSKEFEKLELLNKINILLPAIYNGFSACYKLAALTNNLPEQMSVFEELYERATFRKPTIENIRNIPDLIERYKDIYKDYITDNNTDNTFDFTSFIVKLSALLAPLDIMNKKLKHIKQYISIATKNIKTE